MDWLTSVEVEECRASDQSTEARHRHRLFENLRTALTTCAFRGGFERLELAVSRGTKAIEEVAWSLRRNFIGGVLM